MLSESRRQVPRVSSIAAGFTGLLLLVVLFASCQTGGGDPQASALLAELESSGDLIVAKRIHEEIPLDPTAALWQQAKESVIALVFQISVIPRRPGVTKSTLSVRALHNEKELGFLVSWNDQTKNERESRPDAFRDAVALAFPMAYGDGLALPYIGMGNRGRPVNIWHWKASWQADIGHGFQGADTEYPATVRDADRITHLTGLEAGSPLSARERSSPVENLLAEGFGTLTSVPSSEVSGKGVWQDGRWLVTMKRPLRTRAGKGVHIDEGKGLLPVTFAVWDGAANERDGMKKLTRWRFVRFEGVEIPLAMLRSLVIGPISGADAARGKRLTFDLGCIDCHSLPDNPVPSNLAPDLTNAGAMHRPEYLLESIKEPDAVIVPGPGYFDPETWLSTMLYYKDLPEKDYGDIVEYLRTLQ